MASGDKALPNMRGGSTFEWIEVMIAIGARVPIENFGFGHTLFDHGLGYFAVIRFLLLFLFTVHANRVVRV
jgi:hypothetical protein